MPGKSWTSRLFIPLLYFGTFVHAQPACTRSDWALFCGNGENPCGMAAALAMSCLGDSTASTVPFPSLAAAGGRYTRPGGSGSCVCSVAAYNAFAACAACQSSDDASNWITSAEWSTGCNSFPSLDTRTGFVPRIGVLTSGWMDKSYGDTFNVQQALKEGPLSGYLPLVDGVDWTTLIAGILRVSTSAPQSSSSLVAPTQQSSNLHTDESSTTDAQPRTSSEPSSSTSPSESNMSSSKPIVSESTISISSGPTFQDESNSISEPKKVPISTQILAGSLTALVLCSLGFCAILYKRRKKTNRKISNSHLSPFALELNNVSVASIDTDLPEKQGFSLPNQNTNDSAFVPYRYEKAATRGPLPIPQTNASSNMSDTPPAILTGSESLASALPLYHREIQDPFINTETGVVHSESRRGDVVTESDSDAYGEYSGRGSDRRLPAPPQTAQTSSLWSDGPASQPSRAT